MAETAVRRPLWSNQFAWLCSQKDGTTRVIFGPDPLETTDDDRWLAPDPEDPTKVRVVLSPAEAIRDFITLQPGQFAILTNPANAAENYPNGAWGKGRREVAGLNLGTKRVIASGHFPLWPSQAVEVKPVYRLSPNEYLIVQVVDGKVDETAPYYDVTVKCAADIVAVVDDNGKVAKGEAAPAGDEKPKDDSVISEQPKAPPPAIQQPRAIFQPGQRIRISGTPTYIPPTGVEVVPEAPGREVRQALVLGPTEFCSLIDRDGQPQRKSGPGRVFPGPYDVVQITGSRNNGIYDAYHLRDDRGLLLRVVAGNIKREELAIQLPANVVFDKPVYHKGDEIFLTGISAYLVPGTAIEVIDPETRLPQVGNDHGKVFVKAIGVDQKSGIYVAEVKTGSVNLVRGEKSEVLDPRSKRQVTRRIPGSAWNLMIGHSEPHKMIAGAAGDPRYPRPETMVETPWALSITVPNNEAVLVTSRSGRRCVTGPRTELLAYDETLQVLGLSRGKEKSDTDLLKTCFLRVDGNCVSDRIRLQTRDYVDVEVDVSYGVRFEGTTPEEQAKWFNYTNYVQFFVDHLRSVLRAEARKLTLAEIIEQVAEFVRDTVLGVKPADGHRTGKKFDENNMRVYEVEVLAWSIPDESVAERISQTNRSVVVRQFEVADSQNALETQRVQDANDSETKKLRIDMLRRDQDLKLLSAEAESVVANRHHDLNQSLAARQHQDKMELQKEQADLEDALTARRLEREKKAADQNIRIKTSNNAAAEKHDKAEAELHIQQVAAEAEADVKRLAAVQPQLVEAITGANNANLAGELARSLPAAGGPLGFLLGAGGMKGLFQLVKGTPMEAALKALEGSKAETPTDQPAASPQ